MKHRDKSPGKDTGLKLEMKMTLKFSDGMEFDTSGPLRIESRSDGLYVVGMGSLIPVSSREEAEEIIKQESEDIDEEENSV
jgi:hypothetical protein